MWKDQAPVRPSAGAARDAGCGLGLALNNRRAGTSIKRYARIEIPTATTTAAPIFRKVGFLNPLFESSKKIPMTIK